MAHQSLYRRYRCLRFGDVRGQATITRSLRSAVAEGRVGHAYLFSGPRGTGKTSSARILAKALNCLDLQDGEPCTVCSSCEAMQAGTSYDLQELDAASNNKVEDVRALIERVALGSPGRTKVYILDEVHMLSAGASNALLKTLEEPPDHVVFVLATTDPQKVLPTIRSRTQHFQFNLLPADVMADHVRWVISDAGLDVDDSAVEHVLQAGGGSARDTLSFLDQAAAGGASLDGDHAEALAEAVVAVDTAAALSAVATATIAGRDPRVLGEAFLAHLRDVFLMRMGGPLGHLSDAARVRVEDWAGRVTDRTVTCALEEVGEALLAMRQAPDPRIPLEVALVRITRSPSAKASDVEARLERLEGEGGVAGLMARVDRLEATAGRPAEAPGPPPGRSAAGASDESPPIGPLPASGREAARAAVPRPRGGAPAATARSEADLPAPPPAAPSASAPPVPSEPPLDLVSLWSDRVLVDELSGLGKALFRVGQVVSSDDASLTVGLPNQAHLLRCESKRSEAEEALGSLAGRAVRLVLVVSQGSSGSSDGSSRRGLAMHSEVEEPIDPDELIDAPAQEVSGVDRVTEAFPGAYVVDP